MSDAPDDLVAWLREAEMYPDPMLRSRIKAAADNIEALTAAGDGLHEALRMERKRRGQVEAERDALIHDIERIKDSETAYLNASMTAEAKLAQAVEVLREIAADASVPVHTWRNGINFKKMYEGWRKIAVERIDIARAAIAAAKGGKA